MPPEYVPWTFICHCIFLQTCRIPPFVINIDFYELWCLQICSIWWCIS
jgi:hypothetical protein